MSDHYVPALPEDFDIKTLSRVAAARVDGRKVIIGQSESGKLYVLNKVQGIDMVGSYGSNPAVRALYCRMTGFDSKHLTKLRRERVANEKQREEKREHDRFKLMAKRLGYRVVKTKTKSA